MTLSGFEILDITTYSGNDTVQGGSLGDRIDVFSGSNWVAAGAGDDFVAYRVEGLNYLDGGIGEDVIRNQSADGFGSALQITVNGTRGRDGQGSVLTGFEHWTVLGNNLDDWAQLGHLHDVFRGFDGDDTCYGMGGGDWIGGGYGADMLFGGAGRDQLLGGQGQDTLTGGMGADSFHFGRIGGVGDVITDMVSGEDTVVIDAGLTLDVLLAGRVDDSHFFVGVAQGLGGQFVYRAGANPGIADLIWDANGSDAGGELLIATFANQPGLVAGDLLIV